MNNDLIDRNQTEQAMVRVLANAIRHNKRLSEYTDDILKVIQNAPGENVVLREDYDSVVKRLRHLLTSDYIRSFDKYDPKTGTYKRDILEAVEPTPGAQWISVDERLPDCLEDVIAFNQNGNIRWFSVAYKDRVTWWSAGRIVHHVTHWMPLPEPPESVT